MKNWLVLFVIIITAAVIGTEWIPGWESSLIMNILTTIEVLVLGGMAAFFGRYK
jgi:hypothetical protein